MEMTTSPSTLNSSSKLKSRQGNEKYLSSENVFLFLPNIVDYVRSVFLILFIILSHLDMHPLAFVCYVTNVALDEIDGNLARWFNQTSLLGMMLDIILDEITLFYMCCLIGSIYPQYRWYFQLLTIIDLAGQWLNYQCAAMYKNNEYTRKDNWILNYYFNKKICTTLWVYGNQTFLLSLYLASFAPNVPVSVFGYETGIYQLVACMAAPLSFSRSSLIFYLLLLSISDIGKQENISRSQKLRNHDSTHKLHKN